MKVAAFVCVLACSLPAFAQDAPKSIAFEGTEYRVTAQHVETVNHLGRPALAIQGGRIWDDSSKFTDGVIEFDVAYEEVQGFIGPIWRAENDRRFEEIYFRSHLNEKPDAVQYTPVENGNSAWQIYSDENAIASLSQKFGAWNRARLVVKGDKADFYFNSEAPVLHVPDLKTDISRGRTGLRVSGRVTAYFSNISVRPLKDGEDIVGTAHDPKPLPDGVIGKWTVSSVFPEAAVEERLTLGQDATENLSWEELSVETNGIANISRIRDRLPDGDSTVFIRLPINADKKMMKKLRFGYSDRVRIYLNGKRVYEGDASWQARDYRFLGTVGFFDSVGLDLRKGENELLIAVSETFGGWAWAGAMADQDGVRLMSSPQ